VRGARDYAIFLTDARGIITEWPEGAERVKGYTSKEAIGQPISLFYTAADVAAGEPERELAQAAREGRVERETWRLRKGGERFWVSEIATAVRDTTGKLVGFTRVARDITQKRRAAEALRQLAEADAYRVTLADALRAVSDPVEIQAVASRVLGQHLGVARVLYAEVHGEASIVHRDYTDGVPSLRGVHPLAPFDTFFRAQSHGGATTALEDVSTDPRLPHTERQALLAYGIAAMVSVPLVKGGELRATLDVQHAKPRKWQAAELSRIEETAERTWLAVEQARAETLLRSSEEQFRLALDIETVGVVFFDLKGGVTRANDAFCRMTGYTQGDVEEQRLYFESLTSPESSQVRAKALEELEKLGVTATYEQQCLRKDGSSFWGLFAAKRLGAKQAVEFILDVTERKQAEGALAKAHAELEERVTRRTLELALTNRVLKNEVAQRRQAERLRTDLLRRLDSAQEDERRRVARDLHDQVGQTLTALTLAVRATRDAGALPALVSARLSEVQRAAEELGREVHELAVRLRPTALDDLGLHAALGQLLSDWSARTRIEVDCQLADLEAARLPPDFETVLYRVVQEALTNVARHARAARASVVVQRINGSVIAVVEDDGVGFEPHTATTDRLGLLGLSERVTLAGGTLSIESAAGQGTTLIARLPC
jgi:PAS domain S-box-containing protein